MTADSLFASLRLDGQVAIVTGAAAGIGRATAETLARRGAAVVASDISFAAAHSDFPAAGESGILSIHHDVSDEESWREVLRITCECFGGVSILVNNAGILLLGPIVDLNLKRAERVLAVNVLGPALGIKTVAPSMTKRGGGSIVNVSSIAGLAGFENNAIYCATKWAVRGLSKAAVLELGRAGIRVNTVMPGLVDTPMTRQPPNYWPDVVERAHRHPLGRVADPNTVAEAVAFLVSPAASYCTGTEMVVDGGEASMVGAGLNARYIPT